MILSICVVLLSVFIIFFFTKYKFCSYKRLILSYSETYVINSIFKYALPVILLSVLFGFRYEIGTDYLNYKEIYETSFSGSLKQSLTESNVEYIYAFISHILYHAGLPYYIMFFVMALIPMCFFYAAFKDKSFLIGYAAYFLAATGVLFWFFNIQRQGIAFFILLFSIKYIKNKNFNKFLLCVIIATGFHVSSLLFIFCYLFSFFKYSLIFKPVTLAVIYVFFGVFASSLKNILIKLVSIFLTGKYLYYVDSIESWEMGIGSGLGILSMHIVDLILIFSSGFLCKYFKEYRYDIYFRTFYVGSLFANIAGTNMVLSRFPFCFTSIRFVLLSFLTYYMITKWKTINIYRKAGWCCILGLSVLMLLGNAYNNPYEFVPSL